jgi:hypothetical protein
VRQDTDHTVGAWQRVVKPGRTIDGDLWLTIKWQFDRNQKWELSISGVAGPKANGDAKGSCGQCDEYLRGRIDLAPGWQGEWVDRLWHTWDRWHLNGMKAGTPRQEAFLRQIRDEFPGYPVSHYEWAKERLAEVGLQPDMDPTYRQLKGDDPIPQPYSYGSSWLYEEVPAHVLDFLRSLPAEDNHPWGDSNYYNVEQR